MDPYKVLGISADASEQEVKKAYLSMAAKYHPDHGGDAWVFEQIRAAYEQLAQPSMDAHSSQKKPTAESASYRASRSGRRPPKNESKTNGGHHATPGQTGFPDSAQIDQNENVRTPSPKLQATQAEASQRRHFLLRQLPLQTETSWFILINVLDLVLTNILLQRNAIEANPLANMVFVYYGFVGMIVFKLASVLFVCLTAQIIATKSLSKAKWLLWFGSAVVGAVLIYSCRLIVAMS